MNLSNRPADAVTESDPLLTGTASSYAILSRVTVASYVEIELPSCQQHLDGQLGGRGVMADGVDDTDVALLVFEEQETAHRSLELGFEPQQPFKAAP